jgi:molybdopterin converting factor small subunit
MPEVRVHLPAPLRPFAGGASFVDVEAETADEALARLSDAYELLRTRIFADDGQVRGYVNVFLDGRELRSLSGDDRRTSDGSEITIVPSIAGG